jgi:hypothetical protein
MSPLRLAPIAPLLLCGAALAEVSFVNLPWQLNVGVGNTLPMPQVTDTSATFPISIQMEVVGGCGTLGGQVRTSVPLDWNPPSNRQGWPLGTPPPFLATQAGVCSLRLSGGYGGTPSIPITVYDPRTLHLVPRHPLVSLKLFEYTSELGARIVDSGNRDALDIQMRYEAPAPCVKITQQLETNQPQVQAQGIPGRCSITTMLPSTGERIAVEALVYDVAQAQVEVTPAAVAAAINQPFSVVVELRNAEGEPLPYVDVYFSTDSVAGGPNVTGSYIASGKTDSNGQYGPPLFANGVIGRYNLIVSALERQTLVPIVQGVAGQGPPPIVPTRPSKSVQDMWWAGPSENGWGMSMVQHGDVLFAMLYGYWNNFPRWWVMSGGTWNAAHTVYTGALYEPRGAPFRTYDASRFVPGPSIGTLTLTFFGDEIISMNTVMNVQQPFNTVASTKQMVRHGFGSGTAPMQGLGDMWWGGPAQNGWGISVIQQAGALFAVWYTYENDGTPTWRVLPSGTWTGNAFEGRLYTTRGGFPFFPGSIYPLSDFKVLDVGSARLRFNADGTAAFELNGEGLNRTMPLQRLPF